MFWINANSCRKFCLQYEQNEERKKLIRIGKRCNFDLKNIEVIVLKIETVILSNHKHLG